MTIRYSRLDTEKVAIFVITTKLQTTKYKSNWYSSLYLSTTRFSFWPTAVPAPTPRRTRQKSEITRSLSLTWGQPQPPPLSHLHTSMIFLCLDVCSWPRILILMLPILTREDEQRVGSWEEAGKFYSVPGIRITLTTRQDLSRHCIDMCWAFANTPTWFTGF